MWFDIDHVRETLGWTPQWSTDEMLAESYDWFVANRAAAGRTTAARRTAARPAAAPWPCSSGRPACCRDSGPVDRRAPPPRSPATERGGRRRVLALLAYVPALTSSPGRMPADTKLYLYLDPGRLHRRRAVDVRPPPVRRAGCRTSIIAYLWPSGPWYWLVRRRSACPTGSPTGCGSAPCCSPPGSVCGGCRACSGSASLAALVAAVVYQLSPYVLPYVSRTSVMLLPWAGLGLDRRPHDPRHAHAERGATRRRSRLLVVRRSAPSTPPRWR